MPNDMDSLGKAAERLVRNFGLKLGASAALVVTTRQHSTLLACFTVLVFLDCLTRWVAISYGHLVERGEEHQ